MGVKIEIPQLDTTDYVTGDKAAFEAELNKSGGNSWIKEPGEYILTIDDVINKGVSAKDPNWINLQFKFKDVTGKQLNYFQMFPIKRVNNFQYGPKKTLFIYKGLMNFLSAFGIVLEFDTAMSTIGGVLQNLDSLSKTKITVDVGYTGAYTTYLGKDENDNQQHAIINKGETLKDEDGTELIFADYKAAENYAAGVKLPIQGFPEILNFHKGETIVVEEVPEEENTDFDF